MRKTDSAHDTNSRPYVESLAGRSRDLRNPEPASSPTSAIAASLGSRERSILELMSHAQSNKEMGRDLGIRGQDGTVS